MLSNTSDDSLHFYAVQKGLAIHPSGSPAWLHDPPPVVAQNVLLSLMKKLMGHSPYISIYILQFKYTNDMYSGELGGCGEGIFYSVFCSRK